MQRGLMMTIILLVLLAPVHVFSLLTVTKEKKMLPLAEDASYALPAPILKITTLEFKGISSDFLFLEALVFYGRTLERREHPGLKQWERMRLYHLLDSSTDLDPYFYDPYYFGQATLPWQGNMVREANDLLNKGIRYRDWDWVLPFYAGFNYYYFLHDQDKASEYLMQAAKRPGASSLMATLAARLAYQRNRTENAILFLEEIIKKTETESIKKSYVLRLNALKGVLYLEQAMTRYKKKFGQTPRTTTDMLMHGIITRIPRDPYGGEFYIDPQGKVATTSNFTPVPPVK